MEITYEDYGYNGEHNSRELEIEIEEALRSYDIYLDFETPSGKKLSSETLSLADGVCNYYLTNDLLSEVGYLQIQIVASGEDFVEKSKIYEYYVSRSINATENLDETNTSLINEIMTNLDNTITDLDFSFSNETKVLTTTLQFTNGNTTPKTVMINIDSGDKYITNVSIDYENELMIFTFNDDTTISCDVSPLLNLYSADNVTMKLENGVFSLSNSYKEKIDAINLNLVGFEVLTGTSEAPIYFQNLETGNYILNGRYKPYDSADITGNATNQFIQVSRSSSRVNIFMNDIRTEELECYEVQLSTNEYVRIVMPIPEIMLNKFYVDDAMNGIFVRLDNQLKYENSVEQTTIIDISFPTNMPRNYYSKLVFKTGATVPLFAYSGTVKWLGDGVVNNSLLLVANTIYTINFEKDVFDLVARVETR